MINGRELTKLTYLDAMGIPLYVTRRDLPGAAASNRVLLPKVSAATESVVEHEPKPIDIAATSSRRVDDASLAADRLSPVSSKTQIAAQSIAAIPKFSVAAVVAGRWLWLEELAQGILHQQQVHLIRAMARALGVQNPGVKPMQFDWPMHNNVQLDSSEEAARVSLTSFIVRQLEEQKCTGGVVLLGSNCGRRLALPDTGEIISTTTLSTAEMLAHPALKKQVWRDLKPLIITA